MHCHGFKPDYTDRLFEIMGNYYANTHHVHYIEYAVSLWMRQHKNVIHPNTYYSP